MFNSSNQYGYAAIATPDYIEAAWVCAPNTAGQSLTANTITTLTLDTLVHNTYGSGVSIESNQLTIPAGTYLIEATTRTSYNSNYPSSILAIRNVTNSSYLTRAEGMAYSDYSTRTTVQTQFTVNATTVLELQLLMSVTAEVKGSTYNVSHSDSTVGFDQRTTLKLWRSKDTFNTGTMYVSGGGGGGYTSYAEYGWVCSPNTAAQSLTANILSTLNLTDEVQDIDGIGTLSANKVTLVAGTYAFEASVCIKDTTGGYWSCIFALRRDPSGTPVYVTRQAESFYNNMGVRTISGNFVITSSTEFDLTVLPLGSVEIRSGTYNTAYTNSDTGADQRVTLKVWKK